MKQSMASEIQIQQLEEELHKQRYLSLAVIMILFVKTSLMLLISLKIFVQYSTLNRFYLYNLFLMRILSSITSDLLVTYPSQKQHLNLTYYEN